MACSHFTVRAGRGIAKQAAAVVGVCALLSLFACGSEAPAGAAAYSVGGQASSIDTPKGEEAEGSVTFALTVGNARLDALSYTIVGANFVTSGSVDLTNSTRVSATIGGIPFGSNYALTMNGQSVGEPALTCSGSTSFDLNSVGPIPVPIQIHCRQALVAPPAAPTPAPVPPFAVLALAFALGGLGIARQRRAGNR